MSILQNLKEKIHKQTNIFIFNDISTKIRNFLL